MGNVLMNEATSIKRNNTVDILRGIAMLMVILGHTMTGCTENSQESLLFNIVWTLQMPLFILISGYVTKYSRVVNSISGLWKHIGRKTLSYLLPWAVWSFIIRGVIFGQTSYLNVGWLLYHMDSGYWFLFTLWMIVIIFGVAEFIGRKLNRRGNLYFGIITTGVVYVVGMVLLVGIGMAMGLDFLDIKLTLYYMPFYFAGYMYRQLEEKISQMKFGESTKEAVIAVCLLFWFFLMNRYNFYSIGDNGFGIIIRATASLAGCIAICGLVSKLCNLKPSVENAGGGILLQHVGVHSLEIYLIHYLALSMVKPETLPALQTPQGILLMALNYVLTVGLAIGVEVLINQNRYLRLVLFGKRR